MKIKKEREVRKLCKSGHMISAVKVCRDANPSMGLAGSRDWVMEQYPELAPPPPAPVVTDTQRLDWLNKHDAETFSDEGFGDGPAAWSCTVGRGNVNDRQYKCYQGASIREAIDAAMKATA